MSSYNNKLSKSALILQFKPHIKNTHFFNRYLKFINFIKKKARKKVINDGCATHHILPLSMGGGDEDYNLVVLTYREHYLAHWILMRAIKNRSTCYSYNLMAGVVKGTKHQRTYSSKEYETLMRNHSSWNLGIKTPEDVKEKMRGPRGEQSEEWVSKRWESRRNNGKDVYSDSHKENISLGRKGKALKERNCNYCQEIWVHEEELKILWLDNDKPGWKRLCTLFGFTKYKKSVQTMIKYWLQE